MDARLVGIAWNSLCIAILSWYAWGSVAERFCATAPEGHPAFFWLRLRNRNPSVTDRVRFIRNMSKLGIAIIGSATIALLIWGH
jgi:hypothetical protein